MDRGARAVRLLGVCVGLGRVSRDAALLVIFCALSSVPATTPTVVGRPVHSKFSTRERDIMSAPEDGAKAPQSPPQKPIADGHCSPAKEKQAGEPPAGGAGHFSNCQRENRGMSSRRARGGLG